jgi:hypothetical protein
VECGHAVVLACIRARAALEQQRDDAVVVAERCLMERRVAVLRLGLERRAGAQQRADDVGRAHPAREVERRRGVLRARLGRRARREQRVDDRQASCERSLARGVVVVKKATR